MATQTGRVNSNVSTNLTLRSQPNTSSLALAQLFPGSTFMVLRSVSGSPYPPGNRTDWYEIEFNGTTGFVAAFYVDIVTNGSGNGQSIIDAVNRVNAEQRYYIAHDIGGSPAPETFCNWFAADVLDQLSVPLPRYDASAGSYPRPHPVYGNNPPRKPFSAEALYDFFNGGGNGQWRQANAANAVADARNGKAVVASSPARILGGQGHIAIVLPRGSASNIRIAQAGTVSSNDISFNAGFGSRASVAKFFTYM